MVDMSVTVISIRVVSVYSVGSDVISKFENIGISSSTTIIVRVPGSGFLAELPTVSLAMI